MYVFTILQRAGDVEPITLSVLRTVWNRLKCKGGTTFARLAAKLWTEAPTVVKYDETAKKKSTAYAAKLNGMLAFAPEWEYDGQDGMSTSRGINVGRIWKPHLDATERPRMNARPLYMFELCVLR